MRPDERRPEVALVVEELSAKVSDPHLVDSLGRGPRAVQRADRGLDDVLLQRGVLLLAEVGVLLPYEVRVAPADEFGDVAAHDESALCEGAQDGHGSRGVQVLGRSSR